MKNNLFLIFVSFLFISCETKQDIADDITRLKNKRYNIQQEINTLNNSNIQVKNEAFKLNEKLKELKIYDSVKTPRYVLKIRLKQNRFSLDIGEHMKDAMNAIEFELPVDEEFYNDVSIGTTITDQFRAGAFLLKGSFSSWNMTVTDKNIR